MEENSDAIVALLDRRKNRMIRMILGTKERLYPDEDGTLRKVVLDETNDFFEQVKDIIVTLEANRSIVVNQLFLDKLDEIDAQIKEFASTSGG